MVAALVDTSILVDALRKYPLSINWLNRQTQLGVSPLVWFEVVQGATNRQQQQQMLKLFSQFDQLDLTMADIAWAKTALLQYKLSHNVGMMDCMIASVNYRLQVPLYTTNLKHFAPLLGSLAQRPY